MPLSLGYIREMAQQGIITREEAIQLYPTWVQQPTYMILYCPDHDKKVGETPGHYALYDCDYMAIKVSKRGNDVYRYKVRQRTRTLSYLCTVSDDITFLSGKQDFSNILWITLTFDIKLCSEEDAWNNIGIQLNNFLSKFKQKYGNITYMRSFESFKNGYPHIHLLLCVKERKFPVFSYISRTDGKLHYKLTNNSMKTISGFWHSHVRVEGAKSMGAVGYILKYITKEAYVKDSYTTISKLWYHHKRSYDISRDFEEWISSEIEVVVSAEGCQLDTPKSNSNITSKTWTYLCTINASKQHENWYFQILKPPPFDLDQKYTSKEEEYDEYRRAFGTII